MVSDEPIQRWSERQAHKDRCVCGKIMRWLPVEDVDGWLCGEGCGRFRPAELASEWRVPSRYEMSWTVPAVNDPYGQLYIGLLAKGKVFSRREFAPQVQIILVSDAQVISQEFA